MQRRLTVAAMIVAAVFGFAQSAHASIWDILEELSGPGPFHTDKGNVLVSGFCQGLIKNGLEHEPATPFGIPSKVRQFKPGSPADVRNAAPLVDILPNTPCFFVDFRTLATDPDEDNFTKEVHAKALEAGVTFPVRTQLEIGAGVGFIRFTTGDVVTPRFTMTPLRVVFKPLLLFPKLRENHRYAFLKYYVKETVIVGRLRGKDFDVADSVFSNDGWSDIVTSAGFVIDVFELLGR